MHHSDTKIVTPERLYLMSWLSAFAFNVPDKQLDGQRYDKYIRALGYDYLQFQSDLEDIKIFINDEEIVFAFAGSDFNRHEHMTRNKAIMPIGDQARVQLGDSMHIAYPGTVQGLRSQITLSQDDNYSISLYAAVKSLVESLGRDGPKKLSFVGNSAGGALAALMATKLLADKTLDDTNLHFDGLYTFGAPRCFVGHDMVEKANQLIPNYFRVENKGDIVPSMPPSLYFIRPYRHAGQLITLDKKGRILNAPSFSDTHNHLLRSAISVLTDGISTNLERYHTPARYVENLSKVIKRYQSDTCINEKQEVILEQLAQLHQQLLKPVKPTIIAHRGARATYPENSLAAFKEALNQAMRAPEQPFMIETDLRMTRDGALILMHDETVNRTLTGQGHVAALSQQEIQAMPMKPHAHMWKAEPAPAINASDAHFCITKNDNRVITLRELLDLVESANEIRVQHGGVPVGIALELKRPGGELSTYVRGAVKLISGVLYSLGIEDILPSSFKELHTLTPLAHELNAWSAQYPHNQLSLMTFNTWGAVGKGDQRRLWQQLKTEAKQLFNSDQDGVLTENTAPIDHAHIGRMSDTTLFQRIREKFVSLMGSFAFMHQFPCTDSDEHQMMHTTVIPLKKHSNMKEALLSGVEFITTDYPDRLMDEAIEMKNKSRCNIPSELLPETPHKVAATRIAASNAFTQNNPRAYISSAQHLSQLKQSLEASIQH